MELTLKTVLVSTDFSELGDAAIPLGFRLAKDHGAAVVLVHVLDAAPTPSPLYAHYYPTPNAEQIRSAEKNASEGLRKRIPAEYRDTVRVEIALSHGEPAHEILRIASEKQASVIVIATHGRAGLKHLVLGSTAERVIRHATCPVLVVR